MQNLQSKKRVLNELLLVARFWEILVLLWVLWMINDIQKLKQLLIMLAFGKIEKYFFKVL